MDPVRCYKPVHITLEPNEENTDGEAVTLYFPITMGLLVEDVREWVRQNKAPENLPWVDVDDEYFSVMRTKLQPFPEYTRFQAHPTG